MSKLTTVKSSKKAGKNTASGQFQQHWEKIEKQKRRLLSQEKQARKIIDRFNVEVLPLERLQARVQYQLIEKLLTFFSRKSLSQWQREDLLDWIENELEGLSSNPFIEDTLKSSTLLIRTQELIKEFYSDPNAGPVTQSDLDAVKLNIQQEMGILISDDEAQLFIDNPVEFMVQMQDKMLAGELELFEHDDEAADEQFSEQFFFDKYEDENDDETNGQQAGQALIQRLYRQLTRKLHPDLEQDAEQKKVKHSQIQQVLAAKAENDIYALIELHRQHFASDALEQLESQQLDEINRLLRKQIAKLQQQYLHFNMADDISTAIWRRFKSRNQGPVDQNFSRHTAELNNIIDGYNDLLSQLKNLKDLKRIQEERRYFGPY